MIRADDLNWMTLGCGIAHVAPSLPQQRRDGVWLRVIAGCGYGEESPMQVFSGTLNVALDLEPYAEIDLDPGHAERALYILEGQAQLDGTDRWHRRTGPPPDRAPPGTSCGRLRAKTPLKAMLLGGEPLDGPHHRWWNFVSSSKERTEQRRNIVQGLFH
ncbi:pirin-like C-terminal cupin domain-containing protein [Xanthomonas fragariae]|uniref:pirin-like C-terminal cupin domain-containing protein n=1 Tax=Xanthomonas fragariae TaxID=48664 RepID=UPI003D189340